MSVPKLRDREIQGEIVTALWTLRKGDHIAVESEMVGIEYYHHGIFLDHTEGVADFGGNDKKNAKPRIVDILHFMDFGRRRLVRIQYSSEQCLSPDEVVDNAKKLVENPECWGEYNLLSNNCEHFATRCKTGDAVSHQVIEAVRNCIKNPLQIIRYSVAGSASGSLSVSGGSSCN